MDVFGEHEALRSRSVACHVSSEGIWRIDRFTGPTDVLEAVDRVYADHDRCLDCLTGIHDPQSTVHETLGASSGLRTVYTFRDVTSDCYEVPGLTYKYISKDVLSKSKRQGDTEEWWPPPPRDNGGVGDLSADLEASLRSGLSVEFAKIPEPTYWAKKAVTVAELPTEQRTAVETAVEYGYYETPPGILLADLAEELDLPQSTLQYRLQQTESWIIEQFVRNLTLGDVALALKERDSRIVTA